MSLLLFLLPAAVAAVLAYALTPPVRRLAIRIGAVDQPGPRKIHTSPIPRLGGVAVILAVTVVLAILAAGGTTKSLDTYLLLAIATGAIPIVVISALDDIHSVRAIVKFGAHLAGAGIAVALGISLNPSVHILGAQVHLGWMAIPISILWLAGITSAFNIIDGLDGLSSGLALISAISLVAVSIVTQRYALAATAGVLAGALVGFLPYNLFPAKIYLGDTGATAIGFFLGCLTLSGGSTTSTGLAVVLPMLVVGVPLADTLLSMVRRLARRLEGNGHAGVFDADRDHIHHRLLALGLDQRRAVLTLYGVGVFLALCAFASLFMTHQDAGVLLITLLVAALVGISRLGYDEFAVVRSGAVLRFYGAPVLKRGFFGVFIDLAMVVISLYAAVVLKYDDWGVTTTRPLVISLLALLPATTVAMFALFGIYKRAWSRANVADIVRVAVAVVASASFAYVVARLTLPMPVSATFFATYLIVLLMLIGGSRASYRVFFYMNRRSNLEGEPVVIYGAGVGGTLALREMLNNADVPMKPIGFIDDNPEMRGRFINGFPVLGDLDSLANVVIDRKATGVVIASAKIPVANVQRARKLCAEHGAWLRSFEIDFRTITDEHDLSEVAEER
jgi:UDP-GlcNAc:undecaprenyl-phosphate GlcNAc-1-phosphate transferase